MSGQLRHRRIKAWPVPLILRKQPGEGRQPLLVKAHRQQTGIVQWRVDPGIETPITLPLPVTQLAIVLAQPGKLGLLGLAHGGRRQRLRIQGFQTPATGQQQRGELLTLTLQTTISSR